MDIDSLPKIPSMIKDEVQYHGAANSHNYNQLQEAISFDILNLYNLINEYQNILTDVFSEHYIENVYTQHRMNLLKMEYDRVLIELNKYRNKNKLSRDRTRHINICPYQMFITDDLDYPADINKTYNQVNLVKYNQIHKIYIYDDIHDKIVIPDEFSYEITPYSNSFIVDNDFKRCINNNKHEYWVRKVVDDTKIFMECSIVINMPDNIISNRDVNTIEFSTYPYHSIDVMSVEYKLNSMWEDVPGFKSYDGIKKEVVKNPPNIDYMRYYIEEADNIKLCFNKTPMNAIKINLRQRTYIEDEGHHVFYLGLKHFDVKYEVCNNLYNEYYFDIEFDKIDTEPKVLTAIVPIFNNAEVLSDNSLDKRSLIELELYSLDDENKMTLVSSTPLNINSNRYRVKVKQYYDNENDVNPSLSRFDIQYQLLAKTNTDEENEKKEEISYD